MTWSGVLILPFSPPCSHWGFGTTTQSLQSNPYYNAVADCELGKLEVLGQRLEQTEFQTLLLTLEIRNCPSRAITELLPIAATATYPCHFEGKTRETLSSYKCSFVTLFLLWLTNNLPVRYLQTFAVY